MEDEEQKEWDVLFGIFDDIQTFGHRKRVRERFDQLRSIMDINPAMRTALVEAGFMEPLPVMTGADEYESITLGDQIWADIQKD